MAEVKSNNVLSVAKRLLFCHPSLSERSELIPPGVLDDQAQSATVDSILLVTNHA